MRDSARGAAPSPPNHFLRGWVVALVAMATCLPAMAATWYVRADGGDAGQCSGQVDAPYPGHGRRQACAWQHPFFALPPDGPARIAGGDTLVIDHGDYMIGYGAPGSTDNARCNSDWRWDCHLPPIPSGPRVDQPTRILGRGHDRGCRSPPVLWGNERAAMVLNLEGSSNVEVSCLEITDHSDCIEHHVDPATRCERNKVPFGSWAPTGISASASGHVLLQDLDIHGLAVSGVHAGGLRDWTLQRVRINGNGWVGWNGDIGKDSANAGRIVMRDLEIGWNGCGERWPSRQPHGCWAQQGGGYGDGLGTASTGGQWLIERARVHHNTSDGIDLLYLDGAADTSVTMRKVYAAGNAGNQIKARGTALVEDSVVVGQCAFFKGRDAMVDGDHCRAQGNAVSIVLVAGQVATLRHNTITGEGDCLVLSEGGSATSRLEIHNNALLGQRDFLAGGSELACGHYAYDSPARVHFSGNAFWNVKHGQCPAGSLCGRDPRLADPAMASFDATPRPGSPLIDRAMPAADRGADFSGQRRPVGRAADIGALEWQGR